MILSSSSPLDPIELVSDGNTTITSQNCVKVLGVSIDKHLTFNDKYSLLMHCIKIKSPVKFLLNEQYVFVGGNMSLLCVLSCSSEEA